MGYESLMVCKKVYSNIMKINSSCKILMKVYKTVIKGRQFMYLIPRSNMSQ